METMCTDLSSSASRRSRTNLGVLPCFLPTAAARCWPMLLVGVDDVGDLGIGIVEVLRDVLAAAAAGADDGHLQQVAGTLLRLALVSSRRPAGVGAGSAAATAAARTESSRNCRRVRWAMDVLRGKRRVSREAGYIG